MNILLQLSEPWWHFALRGGGLPHPAVHVAPGRQALVRRDVGVRRRRADPRRRRPALLVLPVRARVDRALRLRGNASLGGKAGLYEYR